MDIRTVIDSLFIIQHFKSSEIGEGENIKNYDAASISRYIDLVIVVINSVLNLVGYQTISNELANNIVAVITGIFTLYTERENNYLFGEYL